MKTLWIISQTINSPEDVGNTRHYSLSKYLAKKGWNIFLISGSIEHLTNRQRLRKLDRFRIIKKDNINFCWIRINKRNRNSLLSRSLGMFSFAFNILFSKAIYIIDRPNIIIGSSPNPIASFAAKILSFRFNVPFIFEVRDLWPETLIQMGAFKKNSIFSFLLSFLEKLLIYKSKKILVLMKGGIKYYTKKGVRKNKVFHLPNGVDIEGLKFQPLKKKVENDPFKIFYLGSMGKSNAIEKILRTFDYLKKEGYGKEKINLFIVGDGPEKVGLQEYSNQLNLDNVFFFSPLVQDELINFSKQADAFIFTMLPLKNLFKYGISFNKIFTYLSFSRPIIYASCASYNPLDEFNLGIKSKSMCPKSLAEAIKKFMNKSHSDRSKMARDGFEYVSKYFSYENLANTLNELL